MDEPTFLLLLLGGAFAFAAVVLLWKFLVTATLIGFVQWAAVTNLPDHPGLHLVAFAVPALLAAFTLTYARRLALAGPGRARRREYVR
ncbi:hypothetical protein Lesp02_85290 [Lentzea sp. NBRC 105346]|uniref:hypothetical protein n=1 Tax=Lentzea sp. NBRC 105346 TaxID=3032205 RepID=UPI00249FD4FC|nr:hypothetical protein [Lentzea sp. NBRC 105346]GLZ36342.1 hypothetical protein Lesp02_85290 [Lentzea sp. NBRC 105346]